MSTMTIEEAFEARASKEAVYDFLNDPQRCFPCLPGATYGQTHPDGKFDGKISVQVGPLKVSYDGWATYEEEDRDGGRLVLVGQGREVGGSGIVKMNMTCVVTETDGLSRAQVVAEVGLAGRLVKFGRGLVKGVSAEVFREFATRARTQLESAPAAAAAAPAPDPFAAPPDPFGSPTADPFGGAPAEPAPVSSTADTSPRAHVPHDAVKPSDVPTAPPGPAPQPAPVEPAKPANGLLLFFRAIWRMIFGSRD